ncbi:FAD/NAD(P)-binding protein [Siphonobacter sp. SORGH_AS_1065]|uniref:FAD/NAD(P)-binding protein n=1 Tax=Siphonobacter sp. SORGH_AS_1065 TaxID=3041795 RepID=UPI0027879894|nr:FAD/NAD(P)-binding protein [Siphonobacter sp. SORGH_AS_1065]MDQ1090125.1 hypothetical protein [Siphonobacter sp. SORGH_AS_1065]
MKTEKTNKRIAILGGGPSGLFVFKRLVDLERIDFTIDIFESQYQLGGGMPYSKLGANVEHISNVSDIEVPDLVTSIGEWIQTISDDTLRTFAIEREAFNEYKVVPRLLLGQYLSAQFDLLLDKAKALGLPTTLHLNTTVVDVIDYPETGEVGVKTEANDILSFDHVIITTGHQWPIKHEGSVPNYYDSPYPPKKLQFKANHAVAIKGASLTAIDAIRTLSRQNGSFQTNEEGKLIGYQVNEDSPDFKIVMHSRNGLLPAIRFHLEEPKVNGDSLMSDQEVEQNKATNDGFLSLDYVFDSNFKASFIEKDPAFYDKIKDMNLEEFVETMMSYREKCEPFELFLAEYKEAEQSIQERKSIHWKEKLAELSFAMNYPAKYFSAEDMMRLQKVLMPLISIVIAAVPQSSCEELLVLHAAGRLEMVTVGSDGEEEPQPQGGANYTYTDEAGQEQCVYYQTFVNCVGQPHLPYAAFPFKSLKEAHVISPARLKFKSAEKALEAMEKDKENIYKASDGEYYLKVHGITINDYFQVVDAYGAYNERINIMAVPYIGGYNPDYSGLDFCEEASSCVVESIFKNQQVIA